MGRAPVISQLRVRWRRRRPPGSNERPASDRSRSLLWRGSPRERRQISSYIRTTILTPAMVLFFSVKEPQMDTDETQRGLRRNHTDEQTGRRQWDRTLV